MFRQSNPLWVILWVCAVATSMVRPVLAADPSPNATLMAVTSNSSTGIYVIGEEVSIQFKVEQTSLLPNNATLNIKVLDEHGNQLAQENTAVGRENKDWSYTFKAPNGRQGFYRVYASLSNGVTIPSLGTMPAGYVTYCIVSDPYDRPTYSMAETRFGIQGGFNGSVNALPYLGVRWVNDSRFTWRWHEPNKSGEYAAARAAAKASGDIGPSKIPGSTYGYDWCYTSKNGNRKPWPIYPVFHLYRAPDWAADIGSLINTTAAIKPEAVAAWAAYCSEVAKAAVEDYPNLPIHFFEITWEPNYVNMSEKQFTDIYKIASASIRAIDKKAVLSGPTKAGLGLYSMDQEALWFKSGFGDTIDYYTVHPYTKMPPEENGYLTAIRSLHEYVKKNAHRDYPFAATEEGEDTHGTPESELAQARDLLRSSLMLLGEGYRFYFAFYIADYGDASGGFGYFYNLDKNVQYGTSKISPKPIAPAFAAETLLLDGTNAAGEIELPKPTQLGYAFVRGGHVTGALWDYAGASSASLESHNRFVTVYDWMGNSRVVPTKAGHVDLALTQDPIYVRGLDYGKYGLAQSLSLSDTPIFDSAGDKVQINGAVNTANTSVKSAQLRLELEEHLSCKVALQKIALPTDATKAFHFTAMIPLGTPPGKYPFAVQLRLADGSVITKKSLVTVQTPVELAFVAPITNFENNAYVVRGYRVRLTAPSQKGVSGTVELSVPSVSQSGRVRFHIAAAGQKDITVPCASSVVSPSRAYIGEVKIVTISGLLVSRRVTVDYLSAQECATAPTIDGDLSDWPSASLVQVTENKSLHRSSVGFKWNSAGLFLSVVNDGSLPSVKNRDEAANNHSVSISDFNESDTVQLTVNLDLGKKEITTPDEHSNMLNRPRLSRITLGVLAGKPVLFRATTFNSQDYPIGTLECPVAIVPKGQTVVYEAEIPWEKLGAKSPLRPGDVLGISISKKHKSSANADSTSLPMYYKDFLSNNSSGLPTIVLAK